MGKTWNTIGIGCIIISIIVLGTWELWGRDKLNTEEIVVLKDNLEKGSIVTAKDIKVVRTKEKIKGVIKYKDLKNFKTYKNDSVLEAKQFIHKEAPLFKEYFMEESKSLKDEKSKMLLISLPITSLEALPEKIDKGKNLFFYSDGQTVSQGKFIGLYREKGCLEIEVEPEGISNLSAAISLGQKLLLGHYK